MSQKDGCVVQEVWPAGIYQVRKKSDCSYLLTWRVPIG